MLETLSVRPRICEEIRSGPLGRWVDDFVDVLAGREYATSTIRQHVRAAAIRLDIDDVELFDDVPCLQIRRTKFRKSRLVPLHPTTAAALRTYAEQRRGLGYDGLSSAFFVSERGSRLHHHALARTFVQLARRLGLRGPVGTRGVSLHKLRHSFAVSRLAAWAQQGVVVRDRLPALAVYLGHVNPQNTYWYLTATPPVLEPAGARFEAFVDGKVAP